MPRINIIIIFNGEVLKYENVTEVKEDDTSITFKDKDEHVHTFHRVSYHKESYWPPIKNKELSPVL